VHFVVLQGSDSPAVAAAAPNQNALQNVVCLFTKENERFLFHENLNFQKFPKTNGTAFSEFLEKRTALRDIPKYSQISYLELPYHLTFLPEFWKFPVEWFALRKFNNFQIFWKLSRGNFRTTCPRFEIFRIFGRMGSAQCLATQKCCFFDV